MLSAYRSCPWQRGKLTRGVLCAWARFAVDGWSWGRAVSAGTLSPYGKFPSCECTLPSAVWEGGLEVVSPAHVLLSPPQPMWTVGAWRALICSPGRGVITWGHPMGLSSVAQSAEGHTCVTVALPGVL